MCVDQFLNAASQQSLNIRFLIFGNLLKFVNGNDTWLIRFLLMMPILTVGHRKTRQEWQD
jgi:hypothetical protein